MRRDRDLPVGEEQECATCGKSKPLSEFPQDKTRIGGIRSQCKKCRNAYMTTFRSHKNPPILADLRAEAIAGLKEEQKCVKCENVKPLSEFVPHPTSRTGISKKCRACIQKDAGKIEALTRIPNYHKNRTLQRQYGIGHDEYMRMFHLQGGVCAICHKPETRKIKGKATSLCVDHDHTTGKIRALLCSKCNAAIGHLEDDIATATALVEYLKQHREM